MLHPHNHHWYLTKIVFRIICGDGDHIPQFEEQLRLISASSKEEAYFKAREVGQKEQDSFLNHQKQLVQWLFINVPEVYRISTIIDGAELYSKIEERDNPDGYISFINKKADGIINDHSLELLKLA